MLRKNLQYIFLAGLIIFFVSNFYKVNQYPELRNQQHWLEEKKVVLDLIDDGNYDQATAQLSQLESVIGATAAQYKAIVLEKFKKQKEEFVTINHREPKESEIIELRLKATDYKFVNMKPDLIFILHVKSLIAYQNKQLEDAIKLIYASLMIDAADADRQQKLITWIEQYRTQKDSVAAL